VTSQSIFTIARQSDGSWLAQNPDPARPSRTVAGWDDVRRLRDEWDGIDHWTSPDFARFIKEFGFVPGEILDESSIDET
jgi:hypothetical protein